MAFHHHPYCCNYFSCSSSSHPPQPSVPQNTSTTDPLLQALAAQFLQSQQVNLYSQLLKAQPNSFHCNPLVQQEQQPSCNQPLNQNYIQLINQIQHQQQQKQRQESQTLFLLQSLGQRITNLESTFKKLSSFSSSTSGTSSPSSPSLREVAARSIQTHFRRFILRRSRILRELKALASIKTRFSALKTSFPEKTYISLEDLKQKTLDLLHQIDSIQSGDSMIREGKKSLNIELIRFLEFVDEASSKRKDIMRVKEGKHVFLAEANKESNAVHRAYDQFLLNPAMNSQKLTKLEGAKTFSKQASDGDVISNIEFERFKQMSLDEENLIKGSIAPFNPFTNNNGLEEHTLNLGFSPPLPIYMESRGQ